jgi:UDP-glucose 4-epimerase
VSRVLVTGGAGYIGSHVVKALGTQGHVVLSYDNLSKGHRDAVLCGDLVVADLADIARLDEVIAGFRPDAVMHFAAFIEVGESVRDPLAYYRNNAANAVNLLSAMSRHGIDKFIFSSTAAVYGAPGRTPVTETEPVRPINPYGTSKAFVETVLGDASAAGALRSVSLRYFNAAGADPEGRIGERHDPESHLIPLVLKAAAGTRTSVSIYGTDYPTPDGTCIRDYVHVEDLVDAHLIALGYLMDGGATDVFNCGYGRGSSVREVIETALKVTGVDFPVNEAPRRPGDSAVLVADSTKLKRTLRWTPRHDDLEFIIRTAWEWEKKIAHS